MSRYPTLEDVISEMFGGVMIDPHRQGPYAYDPNRGYSDTENERATPNQPVPEPSLKPGTGGRE